MAGRGKNPKISIKGDAKGVDRASREATGALDRLHKAGARSVGGLTKSTLGYGAALVGGAGIVGGLEAVTSAASDAEASQAKVKTMVENAGLSWDKYGGHIDRVIQKQSRLTGLDDEALAESFANMLRSTGDVNKALKLNALVADVARVKGTGLAGAQSLVARVYNGSYTGLKRLGIAFDPVTKAQDKLKDSTKHATREQVEAAKKADALASRHKAIALLQKNFGGQAKAYGDTQKGAMDRAGVAVENLEEKLGKKLAPTITKVANKAATFVTQMTDGTGAGGRFAKKLDDVAHKVGAVVKELVVVAGWLKDHPKLLAIAGGAWVAYKVAAVGQIAIVKAASLGLFGTGMKGKLAKEAAGAGASTGKAFAAKAGLVAAAAVGGWEIGSWLRKKSPEVKAAGDFIGDQLGQAIFGNSEGKLNKFVQDYKDALAGISGTPAPAAPRPLKRTPSKKPAGRTPGGGPNGTGRPSSAGAHASRASGAIGGLIARASSGSVSGDTAGLNGDFLNRLRAMSAGTGTPIYVTSGFRSAAEQQALVNAKGIYNAQTNPQGAAPVGSSNHETGLAADISPGRERFGGVASKYGISFPIPGEPWHAQPSGAATPTTSSTSTSAAAPPAAPKTSAYDRLENRLEHIDLLVSAGRLGAGAGNSRKAATIKKALSGLHGDNRLRALTELRQLPRKPKPLPRKTQAQAAASTWTAENLDALLQAALGQIDLLVSAGGLTDDEGRTRKQQILQNALPHLSGNQLLSAQAGIRGLEPEGPPPEAPEAPPAFSDVLGGAISDVDLKVRAGDLSEEQGVAEKVALIRGNLGNPELSDHQRLELRADLGDLTRAITDNTAQLAQQNALAQEQLQLANRALAVAQSEERVLGRALAQQLSLVYGNRLGLAGLTPTRAIAY